MSGLRKASVRSEESTFPWPCKTKKGTSHEALHTEYFGSIPKVAGSELLCDLEMDEMRCNGSNTCDLSIPSYPSHQQQMERRAVFVRAVHLLHAAYK